MRATDKPIKYQTQGLTTSVNRNHYTIITHMQTLKKPLNSNFFQFFTSFECRVGQVLEYNVELTRYATQNVDSYETYHS